MTAASSKDKISHLLKRYNENGPDLLIALNDFAVQGPKLEEKMRRLLVAKIAWAYGETCETFDTMKKQGTIDPLHYEEACLEAEAKYYNSVIALNTPLIEAFEAKNAPLFETWVKKSRVLPFGDDVHASQSSWSKADELDQIMYLRELEDLFWEIADPDGALHKLCGLHRGGSNLFFDSRKSRLDDICLASFFNDTLQIGFFTNDVDVSKLGPGQLKKELLRLNQDGPVAWLEEGVSNETGMQATWMKIRPQNSLSVTTKILGHELMHKLEKMIVIACAKDAPLMAQRYGFTGDHYDSFAIMDEIYDPTQREIPYRYTQNLQEVLARNMEQRVETAIISEEKTRPVNKPKSKAARCGA